MPDRAFTFIDLFAGIGGMRLCFESPSGECVFSSEWNRFSQITYETNFSGDGVMAGDITEVHVDDIPEHDVLLAGFPCQPFSLAGVSKKNSLGRAHGFAGCRSHTNTRLTRRSAACSRWLSTTSSLCGTPPGL